MAIVKEFMIGKTKILINDTYIMSEEETRKSLERVGRIVAESEMRQAAKKKMGA